MKRIEERLELAKAGKETQKLQKEVVLRLDELIKEAENKQKKKDGPPKDGPPKDGPPGPPGGDGPPNDGECPDGGTPGDKEGQAKGNKTSKPADQSTLPSAPPGDGRVDVAKIKKLQEQWGTLPPRERERLLNALTAGMSPSHRQSIENYFRNIALDQRR